MKSTHFRFRGPNNFLRVFVDFPNESKIDFSTPIRSMWTPRSIEVRKNERQCFRVCVVFASWIRRIGIFGTRTKFSRRASLLILRLQNTFCNADSISMPRSILRRSPRPIHSFDSWGRTSTCISPLIVFLSSPLLSFPSFPTSDFTSLRTSLRAR